MNLFLVILNLSSHLNKNKFHFYSCIIILRIEKIKKSRKISLKIGQPDKPAFPDEFFSIEINQNGRHDKNIMRCCNFWKKVNIDENCSEFRKILINHFGNKGFQNFANVAIRG